MRRAASAVFVGVLVVAASACRGGDDVKAKTPTRVPVPFVTIDPSRTSAADTLIERSQSRLRDAPQDDAARLLLARALLQKIGETADPTLYGRADTLLRDLRECRPRDSGVIITSGILALSRHQFAAARALGERAIRLAPRNSTALGILVDANNELGRYDRALNATQAMADARPNLPALTRVSYARELRGDTNGAILALEQASAAAGSGGGADLAYAQALRGNLLLVSGHTDGAEAAFAAAEAAQPGFAAAVAGRAQALVARGRTAAAVPVLEQLLDQTPLAQYASELGDALTAVGRNAAAGRAYDRARELDRRELKNGVDVRLEMAAFDADHDPGPEAVADARVALAARPSSLAHDVLAWNLYRVGDFEEAARESRRALSLGSRDPTERFHAAAIAFARGDRSAAIRHLRVVLEGNPRFNAFLIPEVEQLAKRLGERVPTGD